jgi:hypothetical protein
MITLRSIPGAASYADVTPSPVPHPIRNRTRSQNRNPNRDAGLPASPLKAPGQRRCRYGFVRAWACPRSWTAKQDGGGSHPSTPGRLRHGPASAPSCTAARLGVGDAESVAERGRWRLQPIGLPRSH